VENTWRTLVADFPPACNGSVYQSFIANLRSSSIYIQQIIICRDIVIELNWTIHEQAGSRADHTRRRAAAANSWLQPGWSQSDSRRPCLSISQSIHSSSHSSVPEGVSATWQAKHTNTLFQKKDTIFVFAITFCQSWSDFNNLWQFGSKGNLQLNIAYWLKRNCRRITLGREPT